MGLRITTVAPGTAAESPLTVDPRARLARVLAECSAAVRSLDFSRLGVAFADTATWDDGQRAFQAQRQLVELAFAAQEQLDTAAWIDLYLETASALVAVLEREPSEPVMLNYLGVLLYELTEVDAAGSLFRAAGSLDPQLEHVRSNLKAAKQRKRAGGSRVLKGAPRARAAAIAHRARGIAAQARPAEGLRLSLCMIVKDEEELLPGCLENAAPYVDEMIVVDTGSSDRTVEIARSFGATVIEFPWNGSFADARNVSLDAAKGDWVMYLDADEHLVPEDAPRLRELLGRTWREGFYLVETNYTGGEDSGASVTHLALRLFRNRPDYRFEGRIHEQKTQHMPTYLPERFENTGIRMLHYGYLKSRINAREKSRRNIELLEAEARETPGAFNAFNLGSEYLQLGDTGKARGHFDRAWAGLAALDLGSVGYAPMLAARAAGARRLDGDPAAARELIGEALDVFPDHTDLVFELALCAKDEGNLAEAESAARRCLELGDAPALYAGTVGAGTYLALCLLAEIAEARGDAGAAIDLYRRSLSEFPHFVGPTLQLATLMLRGGADPAEVRNEVPADRPTALMLAATACYEAGHAPEAEGWFREVLAGQPGNGPARIGLLESLLSQRRYAETVGEAEGEPAGSPLAGAAQAAALFALAVEGDAQAVRAALGRSADLGSIERVFYGAWANALAGTPLAPVLPVEAAPVALTALEALLRVREVQAFVRLLPVYERVDLPAADRRHLLARTYFRRGFLDSAADEWIDAYQEAPEPRSLIGLAQVAIAKDLPEDALEFASEVLRLDQGNVEAARIVEVLEPRVRRAS
jgi:tetratricopeptide (TPR) repeat protein